MAPETRKVSAHDQDQVAAFIQARGVTRCPTACAAPTQAVVLASDRLALRQRAERREQTRQTSAGHPIWMCRSPEEYLGTVAAAPPSTQPGSDRPLPDRRARAANPLLGGGCPSVGS